jgi:hypothetical protein
MQQPYRKGEQRIRSASSLAGGNVRSIATLGDKLVQQAAVTILNQIYEVDFQGFSGFHPPL